jgi:undecaprenyl-diphosphatase
LNPLVALILGVVEGLTEYLPVSSTGHLILVGHWLGQESEGAKSFEIVIQLGAILAVLIHYRKLLSQRVIGVARRDPASLRLGAALLLGFIPTAAAGLLFRKIIKAHLFGPKPVAAALIAGGVIMMAIELMRKGRGTRGLDGLEHVTPLRGLLIGLSQCVSLWPGASRSMCTIIGGQLTGLSTATAAEFSFLLALPTLGAATLYEGYKARHELGGMGALPLAIGLVTSFLVAWAVIALFLRYLRSRTLIPFGLYRVALGVLVLLLLAY